MCMAKAMHSGGISVCRVGVEDFVRTINTAQTVGRALCLVLRLDDFAEAAWIVDGGGMAIAEEEVAAVIAVGRDAV